MRKPRPRADRTRYERERRQGIRRTVVASPAIEHLQILRADGATWPSLEQLTGYDAGHLRAITEGRYARIGRELAEDIPPSLQARLSTPTGATATATPASTGSARTTGTRFVSTGQTLARALPTPHPLSHMFVHYRRKGGR